MRHFFSKQFITFILTGGTAAAVNFLSRIVYNQWLNFSTSIILAYLTGMITAFILARTFVFKKSSQSVRKSIFFFSLVNGVAILQTWGISLMLANYLLPAAGIYLYSHEIAHACGVAVPVFTSYVGHKRLSFR